MTVDELIDEYGALTPLGPTVMSALRVAEAAAGCTCGGHSTVRSLLGEALETHADVTLVDMEAGIEHLSRSGGTLAYADILVMVMEPTRKAVITAARTIGLAEQLGIPRCVGVGNKVHLPDDRAMFEELCAEYAVPVVAIVPHNAGIVEADRAGQAIDPAAGGAALAEIESLIDRLDELVQPNTSVQV